MRQPKRVAFMVAGLGAFISSSAWATNWNEAVNGDLSGDRLNPTAIALTDGSNVITATSVAGDLEYFRLSLPSGRRLSQVVVVSSTSTSLSFIAVQAGTQFTEPPGAPVVGNILGYAHFGVGNGTVGTNILDDIGMGAGAIGFTPPLTGPNYTFWSQETSGVAVTYTLDFQVTAIPQGAPVPRAATAVLAVALAAVGFFSMRKRGAA